MGFDILRRATFVPALLLAVCLRPAAAAATVKNGDCLACHANAGLRTAAGASVAVDPERFRASIHGQAEVSCVDCHADLRTVKDFPHAEKLRSVSCAGCHDKETQVIEASVHGGATVEKDGMTVGCKDCHGAHDIQSVKDALSKVSRKNIIKTCGQCHVGIQRDYLEGVHGKDYVKGIKDVPVCTDCHSEHDIRSPKDLGSKVYTTKVAAVCSRCHDDMALSRRYGFVPDRMKTYTESYHGTASKFGEIRVANCASCHGFHDIRDAADPKSSVTPANLPKTCGRCHPGATRHFAEGKIHNAQGTTADIRDRAPQIVKAVYVDVIAAIIGVFLLFIAADLFGRAVRRKTHG